MRIRTIQSAYEEIKAIDPNTSVTEYAIRKIIIDGDVPSTKRGNKYLFDLDKLQKYLEGEA